jgi:hypothetical protein
MKPQALQTFWTEKGTHKGGNSSVDIPEGHILTDSAEAIANSFPPGQATLINYIKITGNGIAKLPGEHDVMVNGLTELNLFPFEESVDAELTIHHDFWFPYSFEGSPQPQVYEANAPRLASALSSIEKRLDWDTEPGDSTFFGKPNKRGMIPPGNDLIIDGKRMEVTDMKQVGWTFQECDYVLDYRL